MHGIVATDTATSSDGNSAYLIIVELLWYMLCMLMSKLFCGTHLSCLSFIECCCSLLLISIGRSKGKLARRRQHTQPLGAKVKLVFLLETCINYRLKSFNNQQQIQMTALQAVTIFIVGLTIGDKHPQAFHDSRVHYYFARVQIGLFPNKFRYFLKQSQMLDKRVERACWVARFRIF